MSKSLTVNDVVDDFFEGKLSKSTVYELIRTGEIPAIKIGKGKFLFELEMLNQWWSKKKEQAIQNNEQVHSKQYGTLRKVMP